MGILEGLNGILLGRPGGGVDPRHFPVNTTMHSVSTVREEYELNRHTIVTNMDFRTHRSDVRHSDGDMKVRIDSAKQEIGIDEAAVIED